jgi:hypothetical protein
MDGIQPVMPCGHPSWVAVVIIKGAILARLVVQSQEQTDRAD